MVEHHLLQERWIDPTNEDPNLLPSGKLNQSIQEIMEGPNYETEEEDTFGKHSELTETF
jgi:hypothetical protein